MNSRHIRVNHQGITIHFLWTAFLLLTFLPVISQAQVSLSPDGSLNADTYFGTAVAVSGDYAIVGADGENESTGAAYVFKREGSNWVQQARLTADDGLPSDKFGVSVAISSTYAVVGASYADVEGKANTGAAYVFQRSGIAWTQQTKLSASDAASSDFFGGSAAISGDYIIMGAAYEDENGPEAGAAYVFYRVGSTWTEQDKLLAGDTNAGGGDYFGVSVSISGYYAIVGAYLHNDPDTNTDFGSVYVFKRNGESWDFVKMLEADDGAAGDYFGRSVSISGNYAAVGAFGDDDNEKSSGSVYFFKLSGSDWVPDGEKETASAPSQYDYLGRAVSVSMSGSTGYAAVGAYGANDSSGTVYLFQRDNGIWSEVNQITPNDGASGDLFGQAVAISGSTVIAGAPGRDNGADSNVGQVYGTDADEVPLSNFPQISALSDYSTPQNQTITVSFTVTDKETPTDNLTVSATSGNTGIIPTANIVPGGSGSNRIIKVTPAAGKSGKVTITVSVRDGDSNVTKDSFVLTVNNPPSITGLPAQVTSNDGDPTDSIAFTIDDLETSEMSLVVSATSSNTTLVRNTDIALSGSGASRSLIITPISGQSGSSKITVSVTDSHGDKGTASLTFMVYGGPIIQIIADRSIEEDKKDHPSFKISDENTAPENLEVTYAWLSSDMPEADITLECDHRTSDSSCQLTIVPPENEFGDADITVYVINEAGAVSSETFTLEVTSVNDAPELIDFIPDQITHQDTPLSVPIRVGDVDHPLSDLQVSASSDNPLIVPNDTAHFTPGGSGADRTLLITPATGAWGTTEITVSVSDGLDEVQQSFTMRVNAKPLISGFSDMTLEEDSPTGNLTFAVSDEEDAATSLKVSARSDNASLIPADGITLSGTGDNRSLIISPAKDANSNMFGTAEIILTLTDSDGATDENRFFVTVNPVNDPPTVSKIGPQQTNEDEWTQDIAFTVTDVEGGFLSVTVSPATDSTYLVPDDNSHIKIENLSRTYALDAPAGVPMPLDLRLLPADGLSLGYGEFDAAKIDVTVTDGEGANSATFFILTIGGVNDPPVISDIPAQTTDEDTLTAPIPVTVQDAEGGTLTLWATSDNQTLIPDAGIEILDSTVSAGAGVQIVRNMSILPALNQSGMVKITVNVDDGVDTSQTEFTLKIEPANDPPTISGLDTTLIMNEDAEKDFAFTIDDVDTPVGNLTVSAQSDTTSLIPNEYNNIRVTGTGINRILTLRPAEDANVSNPGLGDITLTVADNDADDPQEVVATFYVRVDPVNDPPEISGTPDTRVNEGDSYIFTPNVSDTDSPTGDLRFSIENKPSWAEFDEYSGTLSGTPKEADVGTTADIVITVTDPEGASDFLLPFDLMVDNVNDPPELSDILNQMSNEDVPSDPIAFTVSDIEGGRLVISATSDDGTLIPNASINIGGFGPNYVLITAPGETRNLEMVITPAKHAFGTARITVVVDDGSDENNITQKDFFITVSPVNDPPEVSGLTNQVTDEDTPAGEIEFTVSDPEGGILTLSASSENPTLVPDENIELTGVDAENKVLTSGGGGSADAGMIITPADGESGTAEIVITVRDSDGAESSKSFVLTVNYVNEAPTISFIDNHITDEDTPIEVAFTISDVEGGAFPVQVTSENANMIPNDAQHISLGGFGPDYILPISADGEETLSVRLSPEPNQTGPVKITVSVTDGTLPDGDPRTVTQSFYLTIKPVNDSPVISDIPNQDTQEDTAVEDIPFTVNDSEGGMFPGGLVKITVASSNETLVPNDADHINVSGYGPEHIPNLLPGVSKDFELTLTPATGQAGIAEIIVAVDDGSGTATAVSSKKFVLTVDYVNKPPELVGIYNRTTREDEPIDILLGITDAEGGTFNLSVSSSNAALIPNGDVNHINIEGYGPDYALTMEAGESAYPLLTLTPAENQFGTTKITVVLEDGELHRIEETFVLTVNTKNDASTISAILDQQTDEGEPTGNIQFIVGDQEGGDVEISVISSNPALVPNDGDHIDVSGSGNPSYLLNLSPGGSQALDLVITPEFGVMTNDSETAEITVSAKDSESDSPTSVSFTLTVKRVNKAPSIQNLPGQLTVDEDSGTLDIEFVVNDQDGGAIRITITSSNGVVVPNSNISIEGYASEYVVILPEGAPGSETIGFQVTPVENAFGTTILTVMATDNGDQTDSETLVLNVTPQNDAPSLTGIPNQVTDEGMLYDIKFTVGDVEGGVLEVTVASDDAALIPSDNIDINGFGDTRNISLDPNGTEELTLSITPADMPGIANMTVTVEDAHGGVTSKNFVVTVNAVNTLPVITGDSNQSANENTQIDIPFTITDTEGGGLPISVTSSNATLVPNDDANIRIIAENGNIFGHNYILSSSGGSSNLTLRIIPATNQSGSTELTMTVSDGGESVSKVFILTVQNEAPVIGGVSNHIMDEDIEINIAFTVTDAEGGTLPISVTSSDMTLVPQDSDHISLIGPAGTFGPSYLLESPGGKTDLTLRIRPVENEYGETTLTLEVNNGSITVKKEFLLLVQSVADAPIISEISDQTMDRDTSLTIDFTVDDVETPASGLDVTVSSSASGLFPSAGLVLGGSGENRTLKLMPAAGETGTADVTVSVNDGTTVTDEQFTVTVMPPVNTPPTMSPISSPVTTDEDTQAEITLTIDDVETPAVDLEVSATSSNTTLVPNENIVPGYLGDYANPNYQLLITPRAGQSGNVPITVKLSDGIDTIEATFTLQIAAVGTDNDPPEIVGTFSPRYMNEDETKVIEFTVSDTETTLNTFDCADNVCNSTAGDFTVRGYSSKLDMIPNENLTLVYLGKSSPNFRLTIEPLENQNGDVGITIEADDYDIPTPAVFTLQILSINDSPTMTPLGDVVTDVNETGRTEFIADDVETSPGNLDIRAISSNQNLVPSGNVDLDCAGGQCLLRLTPTLNSSGVTKITLTVTDDSFVANSTTTQSFEYRVGSIAPGDINGDSVIDLKDLALGLQVLSGMDADGVQTDADTNGDGKIGFADLSYVLDEISR